VTRYVFNAAVDSEDPFLTDMKDQFYYDPWRGIDKRPLVWDRERKFCKADWGLESVSLTIPKKIPVYLIPEYVVRVPTEFPFWSALPKQAVQGPEVHYIAVTGLGAGAGWRSEGWEPVDADYTDPSTDRVQVVMKYVGAAGKVSGPLMHYARGFKDMLQLLQQIKTWDVLTEIETMALQGDPTVVGQEAQPTGFITSQKASGENYIDKAGAAITLSDIRTVVNEAWRDGGDLETRGYAVTDPFTYNALKDLLTEYLSYEITEYRLPWGIKTFEIDGIPFIKSRGMPIGAGAKAILFLDRQYNWAAVSLDVTYKELAVTGDVRKFIVIAYLNFVNQAPQFNAIIYNIA